MQKVDQIIQQLKDIDVDGETMQYILEQVGMDDQMHRQLIMTKPTESTTELLKERIDNARYMCSNCGGGFTQEEIVFDEDNENDLCVNCCK